MQDKYRLAPCWASDMLSACKIVRPCSCHAVATMGRHIPGACFSACSLDTAFPAAATEMSIINAIETLQHAPDGSWSWAPKHECRIYSWLPAVSSKMACKVS